LLVSKCDLDAKLVNNACSKEVRDVFNVKKKKYARKIGCLP